MHFKQKFFKLIVEVAGQRWEGSNGERVVLVIGVYLTYLYVHYGKF